MIEKTTRFIIERKFIAYTLFAIATGVTLIFTLVPSSHLGSAEIYQYDKLGHFLLFFGWTLTFGLLSFSQNLLKTNVLAIFLVGSFFGIAIELMQGMMPFDRNPSFYDAIADVLGSLTASLILYAIKRRYLMNSKSR